MHTAVSYPSSIPIPGRANVPARRLLDLPRDRGQEESHLVLVRPSEGDASPADVRGVLPLDRAGDPFVGRMSPPSARTSKTAGEV
mgnify:CR=1 FL=1